MFAASTAPPGYELQSEDGSYWSERLQFEYWKSLGLEGKAKLARDWFESIHGLQIEALRKEHPEASDRELERRAAEARYGREFLADFLALEDSIQSAP